MKNRKNKKYIKFFAHLFALISSILATGYFLNVKPKHIEVLTLDSIPEKIKNLDYFKNKNSQYGIWHGISKIFKWGENEIILQETKQSIKQSKLGVHLFTFLRKNEKIKKHLREKYEQKSAFYLLIIFIFFYICWTVFYFPFYWIISLIFPCKDKEE